MNGPICHICGEEIVGTIYGNRGTDKVRCNTCQAALSNAAPDLLEACIISEAWLSKVVAVLEIYTGDTPPELLTIRDAIAKVEKCLR